METQTIICEARHLENRDGLTEYAQALIVATAHVTDQEVTEYRNELIAAIEEGNLTWETVQKDATGNVEAADNAILNEPHPSVSTASAIGALVGYLHNHRHQVQTV